MNKDYYRLNEMERYCGITQEDVLYLAERGKIQLALSCPNEKFIVGSWYKRENSPKKFIGVGVVEYRGLIHLQTDGCKELLDKGKIALTNTFLLQRDLIRFCSDKYPYKIKTPNEQVAFWRSAPLADYSFNAIQAKVLQNEIKNPTKLFVDLADSISKASKEPIDYTSYLPERFRDNKDEISELIFDERKISFTQNDIRITHETANKAVRLLKGNEPLATEKSHREIDLLLLNMIGLFPDAKPSEIWQKLKDDLDLEPRLLDENEIIDEVGDKELYWFDLAGEQQSLKKKSFYNLLNSLKLKSYSSKES